VDLFMIASPLGRYCRETLLNVGRRMSLSLCGDRVLFLQPGSRARAGMRSATAGCLMNYFASLRDAKGGFVYFTPAPGGSDAQDVTRRALQEIRTQRAEGSRERF
jgi:hypothetical protein